MRFFNQILVLCIAVLQLHSCYATFVYTRGLVPSTFNLGDHYPDRNETEECRPIKLRITRRSRLFRTELVTNSNPNILFSSADSRLMSSRMQTRLNALADQYYQEYMRKITVLRAWIEHSGDDDVEDPTSLHYEGRTVRVQVRRNHISFLLRLAVEVGFDWVVYASHDYVRLSVIPDVCRVNIDLVFMLDQSGSVGRRNHDRALEFIGNVISFYNISSNATQVGLVTYSTNARVEFSLNQLTDSASIQEFLSTIPYREGWTATAWALFFARSMLGTPFYGARLSTEGVPKIAVLITDGQSNLHPIEPQATLLRESGVQVYTVGIGDVFLPELLDIASDPDNRHVFLLSSFNDAVNFVDFLSITTCDSPAIVEPGENTTTEVDEDQFRYFQTACAAFSVTVMIEQIDIVGTCSLYASASEQNPGPLSPSHSVVRNENRKTQSRSVLLHLPQNGFVYVSVRGLTLHNTFTVIIWDMIFEEDVYNISVSEGITVPVLFDLVSILQTTNVTFNFTIKSGNDGGHFSLGEVDGILKLLIPLDAGLYDHFLLTIVAQNSEFSCHRGRVKIKIIIIRRNIDIPALVPVSVSEDSEIGTEIGRVEATGGDEGLIYSIASGDPDNVFAINSTIGVISLASALNFEEQDTYNLTIVVTAGQTSNSGSTFLVVNVLDVNEQPFFANLCAQMELDGCRFTVLENQPNGTEVDALIGGDPDLPSLPNGQFTFEFVGTSPFEFILIQNGSRALIVTGETFDREQMDTFDFQVRIMDAGTPPLSDIITVTVIISDLNDNIPQFVQAPPLRSIRESVSIGTIVIQYIAIDDDIGVNADITYDLISVSNDDNPFTIDPVSGVVRVNRSLDFEDVQVYILEVTASNPDGLNSSVTTIISVIDVNDNAPVFSRDVYEGSVEEGTLPGTPLIPVLAADADSGLNGRLNFSIEEGNFNDSLQIATVSNSIGVISVVGSIDREQIDEFNLTIRAVDFGSPRMSSFAIVILNVTDINDNRPIFTRERYEAVVREDAPPMDILTISAFDLDQPSTPNSILSFMLDPATNIGGVFNLSQASNNMVTLSLVRQLNFEDRNSYELRVVVSDQGRPPLTNEAIVLVNVTDANEFRPIVSENQTVDVSEDAITGTVIAQFNVTDLDSMELNFTIVSVEGGGAMDTLGRLFRLDSEGIITLNQSLDFEIISSYRITVIVTDGELSTTTFLIVNVIDENEFNPDIDPSVFDISEEEDSGSFVGMVVASDNDTGSPQTFTFFLIPDSVVSTLFRINPQTGEIFTTEVLDREGLVEQDLFLPSSNSTEFIRIEVTDSGVPPRSSIGSVGVVLKDINDNPPIFQGFNSLTVVPENETAGQLVANLMATDRDLGANGTVEFSITVLEGVDNPFVIDDNNAVRTSVVLDSEVISLYVTTITAMDGGQLSLSTEVTLLVNILDRNDNAPVFSQEFYEVDVPENVVPRSTISRVEATDIDIGLLNSRIEYSIQSSSPPTSINLFNILNPGGFITVQNMLDFETTQIHNLTIIARDQGSPQMAAIAMVTIRVTNVDEIPPRFLEGCSDDLTIIEESINLIGQPIRQCIAGDIDEMTGEKLIGANLTYEIISGNINDTFRIGMEGTVFLEQNIDREVLDFYSIVLQVTDDAGLSNTAVLNIDILDINDNIPDILNASSDINVTVADIQDGRSTFFTVQAIDRDAGMNAELLFSIEHIEVANNGRSTVLTVLVLDRGTQPQNNSATITLVFQTPCFLQDHVINATNGILTSSLLCDVNLEPMNPNVTIGDPLTLSCSAVSNIPVLFEFHHNNSAVMATEGSLFISAVSFQSAGEYVCIGTSAIGNLQSANNIVRIHVPPTITMSSSDQMVMLEQLVQLTCSASGLPQPEFTWSRVTVDGVLEVLMNDPSNRIAIDQGLLLIFPIRAEDEGIYVCTASNPAGQVNMSSTITFFSASDVVMAQVMDFSNPNTERSCHVVNQEDFEMVVTDITGSSTTMTNQNGFNLCDQTACSPSPCLNGGSCLLQNTSSTGYECSCGVGYKGVNCELDTNECMDEPCLSGGTCSNIPGSFACSCPPGVTGHRCQYGDTCSSPSPCPSNQTCVLTVTNTEGFVCQDLQEGDVLMVTVSGEGVNVGSLDDQVNILQELNTETSNRRRRQTEGVIIGNGFVTVCEARFIQLPDTESDFFLVWVCPEGISSPSLEELDDICRVLFADQLVSSCSTPSGLVLEQDNRELPSTNATFSFILLGADGQPLSGRDALTILIETDAIKELRARGYQVTEFTIVPPTMVPPTMVPSPTPVQDKKNEVVMVVGGIGVVLLVVMVFIVVLITICFIRTKRSKKKLPTSSLDSSPEHMYHLDNLTQQNTTRPSLPQSPPDSSLTESLFDEPVYGMGYDPSPPATTRGNLKTSSLERAKDFLKRKTESTNDLLAEDDSVRDYEHIEPCDDYQAPPIPPRTDNSNNSVSTGRELDESVIYSNTAHCQLGAQGNAGRRWESYQLTNTLFQPYSKPKD